MTASGLDRQRAAPAPYQGGSARPRGLQQHLPAVVHAWQQAYPTQAVARWATDPHRLGLTPLLRRVCSPRGQRPGALVPQRDQGCSRDAFVHPGSGRPWWLFRPTVSMAAFTRALAACAPAGGAGPGKPVLVGLAGAGGHVSAPGTVPAGGPLHFRPPYAPAWPPAERLWPLPNEALAHRHCRDVAALQTVQADRGLQ